MFNNLIESTSHVQEFKRRGSFLLFTSATYALLFVITGVVSIYAYDAHLEARMHYDAAPYGVGYFVADWTTMPESLRTSNGAR